MSKTVNTSKEETLESQKNLQKNKKDQNKENALKDALRGNLLKRKPIKK